jgi:orotidine-5'-phosphate decarboxylase
VDQLLIALDVERGSQAIALADTLRDLAGGFKIGSRLFTSEGPAIVRTLVDKGDRVFLDLKFHDIPNTVAQAISAAAAMGVWMVNVHASGGRAMMAAAKGAAVETADRMGTAPPLVIAVTVLTSMSEAALVETGCLPASGEGGAIVGQVVKLAILAQQAGLDGVVASPQETAIIRRTCGDRFAIVTPGIRGGGAGVAGKDDQERTMSAADAIAAGAHYIVVGRPIIAAPDPREAAEGMINAKC